jgi:RNA polymerase sigma-70 factor (ECF subfamily)
MMQSNYLEADQIFSDFYEAHQSWLLNWLRRRLTSTDQAADLAQDTFVSIISKQTQEISEISEPRAYLTKVAQCILANYYQRQSLEAAYLNALEQLPEAWVMSTETRLILLQTLHEIDAMLDALPAKVRHTFLLSQLEGLSYSEISTQLDVSVRTIKRYMAQAFEHCLVCML